MEETEMIYDEQELNDKHNLFETDIYHNPKNDRINVKKSGGKIKKKVRPKKHEPEIDLKVETNDYVEQNNLINDLNLELSEQFIHYIIEQVNALCENITNGDPNIARTTEVNQKINEAVDCYRNILGSENQIFVDSGYNEYQVKEFLVCSKDCKLIEI